MLPSQTSICFTNKWKSSISDVVYWRTLIPEFTLDQEVDGFTERLDWIRCDKLLIITWFGEADNLRGLRLNLVVKRSLPIKAGDLHPAVLSHFPGMQPPQRRHHRSLWDGVGDVGSVSHLQPVQYVSLHRLQKVYVQPLWLIRRPEAAGRARLLGRALSLRAGHWAAAHGHNARN